ncbi:RNA polymerase sigma factor [Cyclobacterium amurskyense]|uniref:RNA polymerase sigma factor n=1 Tax=Cyclobacterium amurskyense TaxID=320787 RepID=UPI0030DBB892|tara:strand:+ start:247 stop:783 length:537 start_codon:yes stop_codon:yes gene_type:complete
MTGTDRKEIELVFKEHYREFCLLSFSYVACMDQAQDIVQDVFVKLLSKCEVLNTVNLEAYVWKSVKNNSLKQKVRTKKLVSLEEIRSVVVEDDKVRDGELDNKLRNAMDKLPPKCRNVFELCAIDGQKYDSAADSLGVSVNTVKTQMKKAYRILRHNLADMYLILLFFAPTIEFFFFS